MNQRINYEKVAQVALDYALTKSAVGAGFNWQHALMGAGLGAGAGALSGLVAPGKDDEDETDRSGSAIMRGLLGGALGGAAGGFGGKYITPYLSGAELPLQRAKAPVYSDRLPAFNERNV